MGFQNFDFAEEFMGISLQTAQLKWEKSQYSAKTNNNEDIECVSRSHTFLWNPTFGRALFADQLNANFGVRTHFGICLHNPTRELLDEVEKLSPDQVQVISHIGGLVKSFEQKAA